MYDSSDSRPSHQGSELRRIIDRCQRNDAGCLIWTGYVGNTGYGQMRYKGKLWSVHRLVFVLRHGDVPNGMCVCHSCDTPACVEDAHHWLGTRAQNNADKARKGRAPSGPSNGAILHPERIRRGERSGGAKLTEGQVRAIRRRHGLGEPWQVLSCEYGIVKSTIYQILRRESWGHVND